MPEMRRCAVLAAYVLLWLPYCAAIGLYGAATFETLPTVASTPALPETSDTVRANYGNYTTRTTLPAAINLTGTPSGLYTTASEPMLELVLPDLQTLKLRHCLRWQLTAVLE